MSLEKEIQQKQFGSDYLKVIINILYTQNFLERKMASVFKEFNITRQQFNVLRILRGQYPKHASINLIKDRMIDKMSDTSRIVERLRLKGLVHREDGKDDKRSVEVTITQAGLDLLQRMEHPVESFETLVNHLSVEEAKELNRLLDKIRAKEEKEYEKGVLLDELLIQPEKI